MLRMPLSRPAVLKGIVRCAAIAAYRTEVVNKLYQVIALCNLSQFCLIMMVTIWLSPWFCTLSELYRKVELFCRLSQFQIPPRHNTFTITILLLWWSKDLLAALYLHSEHESHTMKQSWIIHIYLGNSLCSCQPFRYANDDDSDA